jgi:dipeptidyl aminopeptidase/acylaminoacyl peptidase
MTKTRASFLTAAALFMGSCQDGTGPVTFAPPECENAAELSLSRALPTVHRAAVKLQGKTVTIPGMTWASGDSVRAFFGNKEMKLVFVVYPNMYLLTYESGEAHVTLISHGDEGLNGGEGTINSPLFSPDGKKIVFAGTSRGKPAFILDAVAGEAEARRLPLDPKAHVTADPHWFVDSGKTFVYFSTLSGLVNYNPECQKISGNTYRVEVLNDSAVDSIRVSGIPGAFRGGLSRDGNWVGTSYAASAVYDRTQSRIHLLGDDEQQCNPSMNPFPVGSKHMDYMMILAFGGVKYKAIDGTTPIEKIHENLWIYNKDNKIVWQGKRPDEAAYLRYDKPEWSTHPNYATAVALECEIGCGGDLYVLKIGDLADADEGKLNQAEAYLKIGSGTFNSESFSHLWVAP